MVELPAAILAPCGRAWAVPDQMVMARIIKILFFKLFIVPPGLSYS